MAPRKRDSLGRYAKVPTHPAPIDPAIVNAPAIPDKIEREFLGHIALPHQLSFTALWQSISKSYYSLDDEAKLNNYRNALAMRRDAGLMKSIRARQIPVTQLDFVIEVEDPDDQQQKDVAKELTACINAVPRFQGLKLNLSEAVWFGKAGVQLVWDWKTVLGKKWVLPVDHYPVNGDKIITKWDGTPGVLIYRPFNPEGADIEQSNWGPALFLYDEWWRDRFVIHRHQCTDADYLYESELAGQVGGVGLRSEIYWVAQLRAQVLGWLTDGLQRVGTNGMLIGYFPTGDTKAQQALTKALDDLIARSVTTIPVDSGHEQITRIEAIQPSTVAYDTLMKVLHYFDQIIEVMILGQPLSSSTASTGMGSDVAELHAKTLERILLYDAVNLSETLTTDLLHKIIKFNYGVLPFNVKLKLVSDKVGQKDLAVSAKALYDMQVPFDADDVREKLGFAPPRSEDTAVINDTPKDQRIGDQDHEGDFSTHTELPK